MQIIEGKENIRLYRLITLRGALKLEILGMKRRGRSAYAIIKDEFKFKGSKKKVLEQLEELITKTKEEINVGSNDPEAVSREAE
jgi:hypothetical protein